MLTGLVNAADRGWNDHHDDDDFEKAHPPSPPPPAAVVVAVVVVVVVVVWGEQLLVEPSRLGWILMLVVVVVAVVLWVRPHHLLLILVVVVDEGLPHRIVKSEPVACRIAESFYITYARSMYNRSWQKREEEGDLLLMDRIYFLYFLEGHGQAESKLMRSRIRSLASGSPPRCGLK
jgi:hypothetical protein